MAKSSSPTVGEKTVVKQFSILPKKKPPYNNTQYKVMDNIVPDNEQLRSDGT